MIISETQTGYTAGKQTRDEMGMGEGVKFSVSMGKILL